MSIASRHEDSLVTNSPLSFVASRRFRQSLVEGVLARTSHHLATAARGMPQSAAFSRVGVLDVPQVRAPRPSGRKRNISRHLAGLATHPNLVNFPISSSHHGGA